MIPTWLKEFKTLALASTMAAAGLSMAPGAQAAEWPDQLVRLIVPYPAGGPSDVMTRQFAPALEGELGETVLVENVGGGGGTIGVNRVLRADPDGYHVLLGSPMELIQAPLSMESANFESDDVQLAGMVINTDLVLIARQDLPYDNIDELIAAARESEQPDMTYGSVGYGSLYHLAGEYFARQSDIELLHVPYRGGGPVIQDLMGGQIDLAFIPLAGPVHNLIESGRVKPLAIASAERHPLLPNLPRFEESETLDSFRFDIWAALAVPRGTPDSVRLALNDALARAVAQPDVKASLEANGPKVSAKMNLDEMAALYASEIDRYQAIANMVGIEPQ